MGVSTEHEACTECSLSQNGCSHSTLQKQSPDVHRSNPLWVLKTVEANQPHGTTPTSVTLLQPAQCPLEMWEIFMSFPVLERKSSLRTESHGCWWPHGLGRRSAASRLLGLGVRIPLGAWMSVSYECRV
jgi:hypothetical protein